MPWCLTCDRFLSPSSVTTTGCCPQCGRPVDPGKARIPVTPPPDAGTPATPAAPEPETDEMLPVPWHLKLLAAAVALYLGYRAFEGIEWIAKQF